MPVEESFTYEGLGTGLPFCIKSEDVSGWYSYAPLNIGQLTQLFFNFHEVKGSATLTKPDAEPPVNISVTDSTPILDQDDEDITPKKRVCGFGGDAYNYEAAEPSGYYAVVVAARTPQGITRRNISSSNTEAAIIKMYNGSVDEPENFLGYGFEGWIAKAAANEDGGSGNVGQSVMLASHCRFDPATEVIEEQLWFDIFSIYRTNFLTVSKTTVSDIEFVEFAYDGLFGATGTAEITGLEFYTYS
jgi:hypothetical protein